MLDTGKYCCSCAVNTVVEYISHEGSELPVNAAHDNKKLV